VQFKAFLIWFKKAVGLKPPILQEDGYRLSIPEVNLSELDVYHPTPATADVEERVEPYIYYLSGSSWFLRG